MGKLYGVSVGAGDPQLLTLKAVRILEECGVIAVPRTKGEKTLALSIAEQAVDLSGKRIVYLDIPMSRDRELLDRCYGEIAELLCGILVSSDAAVPVLGDVSVYSTFSHIAERVKKRGFAVEICPGVTSFSAAAAALKEPLCIGSEPLHIIPFGCDGFEELLDLRGTKVIMKAGSHSGRLTEMLREKHSSEHIAAVENCGLPDERIYADCNEVCRETGYYTVFIMRESSDET